MSNIQQLNPSETATIQNASEFSEETVQTVQNTQSLTITNYSNLIQVPTHNITPDQTNNQNQDNTLNTTQDNTSILSTSHTNVTQPSQTQRSLVKIMTHFLFHLSFQLKSTLIVLLNKSLLIPITLIQSTFKPQLHHHLLKYKLQLMLQLKVIQYKMYKLV